MIDCLMGALAQALPHRVTADGNGGATLPSIGGYDHGKPFVYVETMMGTWGAAATHDGQEGVAHIGANQSNVPIELIEAEHPLRIEQYALLPDSGGPGRFRGGLGIVRDFRLLGDDARITVRSDKRRFPPYGLAGGKPGTPSWNIINPDGERRVLPVLTMEPTRLRKGDMFRHIMAGGGGYGDPFTRDPLHVLDDVVQGKITVAHAREAYGVAIIERADGPAVDHGATAALRGQPAP
jgi:N-methylhydantoinase B